MNRAFSILGVREDACKEEIKQAYERRLSKYKSGDYADDPEYVSRKIAQLREAYNSAYAQAPEHSGDTRFERRMVDRNRRHEEYEEERRRAARKADDDYEKPETYKAEKRAGKKAVKKAAARHYEHKIEEKTDTDKKTSGSKLDLGQVLNNLNEKGLTLENQKKNKPASKNSEDKKTISIFVLIVTLLPLIFGLLSDIGNDDDFDDDSEYSYNYEYITDEYDQDINNIALSIRDDAFDNMVFDDDAKWQFDSDKKIKAAADEFIKAYFGENNINNLDEMIEYLSDNYDYDSIETDDMNAETKIMEVLNFYGFPMEYDLEGGRVSIDGEEDIVIDSTVAFLNYLTLCRDNY